MAFLVRMHDLSSTGSQFIISPIILTLPEATIYQFSDTGMNQIEYSETEAFLFTKRFVNDTDRMLKMLFEDNDS